MIKDQTISLMDRGTIRASGRRMTSQRALLLDLIESADKHLDAEELFDRARMRDSRISLSTVYRTLALLKDLAIVEELHLAENHHHYEPRSVGAHDHLVCLSCGKVEEFRSPLIDALHRQLFADYHFVVTDSTIEVSGYCRECQEQGKDCGGNANRQSS